VSRRKGWMFFALGLILALGAGAMVFVVLQQQAAAADKRLYESIQQVQAQKPTKDLPVAARPLEPGTKISSADYVTKSFPLDLVPLSAITDTAQLDNKLVVRAVGQGETFQTAQLLGGESATMSQQIKQGNVLFAFPIVDLMGQSDVLKDGDHVDLLITLPLKEVKGDESEKDLGKATALTLQNIEVFKVLRSAKQDDKQEGAPTALMCSVTPADAVILKYAKDSGGVIDFALRSPADTEPFTAPWIDRVEFSKRYIPSQQ
jgi:pilus assembly protein CpaB